MPSEQCRYMQAAYPELDADESCTDHRHDEPTFALARALAVTCQDTAAPDDEQIAWFLDDAGAIVDDFVPTPTAWSVARLGEPEHDDDLGESTLPGIDFRLAVNGVEYVVPESEWEPSHPVRRTTWEADRREAEGASDADESDERREHDPALVAKAAEAIRGAQMVPYEDGKGGWLFKAASPDHIARAVLDAVADDLRAEALREAADECGRDAEDGHCGSRTCAENNRITARWLRERAATRIEARRD